MQFPQHGCGKSTAASRCNSLFWMGHITTGQEKGAGMKSRRRGLTRLTRVKSSLTDWAGLTSRLCALG